MITLYSTVLFIHVSAAMVWLGGGIILEFLNLRLGDSPTRVQLKEFFSLGAWLSPRVFVPASLTVLVSGIALVAVGKHHFSDFSIVYALVVIVCAMLFGAFGIGPTIQKIVDVLNKPTIDQQLFSKYSRKLRLATNFDLALLISILFDVVVEPKWDSYPFFIITGIFLVGVVVYNLAVTPHQRVA